MQISPFAKLREFTSPKPFLIRLSMWQISVKLHTYRSIMGVFRHFSVQYPSVTAKICWKKFRLNDLKFRDCEKPTMHSTESAIIDWSICLLDWLFELYLHRANTKRRQHGFVGTGWGPHTHTTDGAEVSLPSHCTTIHNEDNNNKAYQMKIAVSFLSGLSLTYIRAIQAFTGVGY